jgi:putative SOS response-associated peptidase YedK
MSGRFTLSAPPDAVADLFGLADAPDLPPRYNIAPSQPVACVRGGRSWTLDMLRWGLIPGWANDAKIGHSLINARAESIAEKPAFRAAFRQRRCLIPADGFYVWAHRGVAARAFHVRLSDYAAFAFAGLWETWVQPGCGPLETCCIITTMANDVVARVTDRMPVLIDPGDFGRWLDPAVPSTDELLPLLRPYPAAEMMTVAVGPLVNSPKNDDPSCLLPAA